MRARKNWPLLLAALLTACGGTSQAEAEPAYQTAPAVMEWSQEPDMTHHHFNQPQERK